jgi:hypothetical protein
MAVMTIFPEQSEIKEVAKLLLQLADTPRDVTTTLDPTIGFTIPLWLYELFVETWDLRFAPVTEPEVLAEDGKEVVEPVKRKPGRPRREDK